MRVLTSPIMMMEEGASFLPRGRRAANVPHLRQTARKRTAHFSFSPLLRFLRCLGSHPYICIDTARLKRACSDGEFALGHLCDALPRCGNLLHHPFHPSSHYPLILIDVVYAPSQPLVFMVGEYRVSHSLSGGTRVYLAYHETTGRKVSLPLSFGYGMWFPNNALSLTPTLTRTC